MPVCRFRKLSWLVWLILPLLLWWAWRDISPERVILSLRNLTPSQILILISLNGGLVLLFSMRWWFLLRAFGYAVPLWRLSVYRTASFAVSFLTPGPQFGGEPLQVYALTRRRQVPGPVTYASVVLDRMLELLANFTFLAVAVAVVLLSGVASASSLRLTAFISMSLILLPSLYVLLLVSGRQPVTAFLQLVGKWIVGKPALKRFECDMEQAESQVGGFCRSQPFRFFSILAFSLFVWVFIVFEYWLSFSYLGLVLSLPQVLFMMLAARLALLLPMPGGIGVLEASQVLAVGLLGLDPVFAASFMLLARSRDTCLALIGVIAAFMILHAVPPRKLSVEEAPRVNQPETGGIK